MTENINIIGGTAVERILISNALSKINVPIKIFIDDDSHVTAADFYIGENLSNKTSHNFIRPIRLGNLLNSAEEKYKKEKQKLDLKSIQIDCFSLSPKSFLLRHEKQEKEIYLTEKETALLQYLAQSEQEVSREILLESIWGYMQDLETHTLETHLYRLRQKLENEFNVQNFIMFGDTGYYLNLPHNAEG